MRFSNEINKQNLSSNLAGTKRNLNSVQLWFCGLSCSLNSYSCAFSRFSSMCTVTGSNHYSSVEFGQGTGLLALGTWPKGTKEIRKEAGTR